jgi:hypothetical protein
MALVPGLTEWYGGFKCPFVLRPILTMNSLKGLTRTSK